jgi:XapX domain-containing protein
VQEKKMSLSLLFGLLVGIAVGVLFSLLKLPVPAPAAFEGVLGIVGMFIGRMLTDWLRTVL